MTITNSISSKTLERINKLIDELPEIYQPIYLQGELIREGVRQNDWERLEVIKKLIKPGQTVLDIGSNVGFFTIELAKIFPENVFVSVEKQVSYAKLQKELLQVEKLTNVILINSEVTVEWLKAASQACTYFDVTLLLSVLHHMKDASEFLQELSKISKSLIIELPNPNESKVCGKEILREQLTVEKLKLYKPIFEKLDYESTTHCDADLKREFYYADSPKYHRESCFPYIGYPVQPRNYRLQNLNGKNVLYKEHLNETINLIPGVLLYDLHQIGSILYPNLKIISSQLEKEFKSLDGISNSEEAKIADIRPWNILFTSEGLKFIDCKYTSDLDYDLIYDRERDLKIISNYLEAILPSGELAKIVIDGVFFQLYRTGIARVWNSLLEVWAKNGFAKHFILIDRGGTAPKIPGIQYYWVPPYDYNRTELDRAILQEVCDEVEADIFISSYYTTPVSTPSVFIAYDMIPEALDVNLDVPMWREKHYAISHATAYISISENTACDLAKFFPGIPRECITVAHCGVEAVFSPASPAEVNSFKIKYGISKPYFIGVGCRPGHKNSILFFRGFAQLATKHGFEIVCTGSGVVLEEEIRNYTAGTVVHNLQLSDEELSLAYSGAVALVYPSQYEGFGLPVLEALSCGCPVITCPNASIPEVAGEAALYVNDDDVEGLAEALCEVQKPKVRNSLIAAGLEQAKKFSWSKMAKTVSSALIEATLVSLNLKEINLIIFPDWTQPEDSLYLELEGVVRAIATHPNKSQITLLVETSNISEEDANLALSSVAMNLLMQEDLDVSDGPELALIGQLSEIQRSALIPRLHGRIVLDNENREAIAQVKAENITLLELDSLKI